MTKMNQLRTEAKEKGLEVPRTATKTDLEEMLSPRAEKEKRRERRGGNPLGGSQPRLNRPEFLRDGYNRRFINDDKGRLNQAYENDYDFVVDREGQRIKERVGSKKDGTDLYAFLMEKPSDWYLEDQIKKHRVTEEKEKQIKSGGIPGAEDAFKGVKQYQPKEGIKISTGISQNKLGD